MELPQVLASVSMLVLQAGPLMPARWRAPSVGCTDVDDIHAVSDRSPCSHIAGPPERGFRSEVLQVAGPIVALARRDTPLALAAKHFGRHRGAPQSPRSSKGALSSVLFQKTA